MGEGRGEGYQFVIRLALIWAFVSVTACPAILPLPFADTGAVKVNGVPWKLLTCGPKLPVSASEEPRLKPWPAALSLYPLVVVIEPRPVQSVSRTVMALPC